MHTPVFQKEILRYLEPRPNENFIDTTLGQAGHALAILERNGPKGKVLGIEWDPDLISQIQADYLKGKARKRLIVVNDSYLNLKEIVKKKKFRKVKGILFDLGISSWHLEKSGRGFSFQKKEPLDMRYNSQKNPLTAEKIINFWSKGEIEKVLKEYGQEKFAKKIAEEIVKERKIKPLTTTSRLVEIIKRGLPKKYLRQKIHFATRVFQALRIAVNEELNNLKKALPQALEIVEPGGRLVVISFHSLEDRIVKNFFREKAKEGLLKILTQKPLIPSSEEIESNPRSRSAKLRAAIKI